MIARVKFEYGMHEKMVQLSAVPETYERFREVFGHGCPSPENRDKYYHWPDETLLDLTTDGHWLAAIGIEFTVKKFKGTMPLNAVVPGGGEVKVFVQVPHVGLLAIDEVEVLEDCCTENLQGRLDTGWRILCVCPPNAARRPDYILGRTKERS